MIWAKKKNYWVTFLEDSNNIWKAARYLKPTGTGFGDIPLLLHDGREIENDREKAAVLLDTFFLPTPPANLNMGARYRPATRVCEYLDLTLEEVE